MKRLSCLICLLILICGNTACSKNETENIVSCKLCASFENDIVIGNVSYLNYQDCLNEKTLLFNLYPNKIYSSANAIEVLSVTNGEKPAEFAYEGNNKEYLSVKTDGKSEVVINFKTTLLNGNERLAVTEGGANLTYFFPHIVPVLKKQGFYKCDYLDFGDPFYDAFCDFEVDLTVRSTMAVACGSTPVYCTVKGETTAYGFVLPRAKTFAVCVNQNYAVVSKKWGNKSINYYYIADDYPEKRLETIILALDFFNETVGEYRFKNLTVAQTQFNKGGMEYPAFCMLAQTADEIEYNYALIHELAHQYFPVGVDLNQYENAFFDEGFAEYLAMKYFERYDYNRFSERLFLLRANVNAFEKAVESGKTNFKGNAIRPLNEFSCEYEYVTTVYRKGFFAFYDSEKGIGEKRFLTGLKNFYNKFNGKNATVQDFFKCFSGKSKTAKKLFLKSLS